MVVHVVHNSTHLTFWGKSPNRVQQFFLGSHGGCGVARATGRESK